MSDFCRSPCDWQMSARSIFEHYLARKAGGARSIALYATLISCLSKEITQSWLTLYHSWTDDVRQSMLVSEQTFRNQGLQSPKADLGHVLPFAESLVFKQRSHISFTRWIMILESFVIGGEISALSTFRISFLFSRIILIFSRLPTRASFATLFPWPFELPVPREEICTFCTVRFVH